MKKVYANLDELSNAAAELFISIAQEAITKHSIFTVALAGGSTPVALYKLLAEKYADTIDWNSVHFFWGDERNVPSTDDLSNYKMANESLLAPLKIPKTNVHRIQIELGLTQAAESYDTEVLQFFREHNIIQPNGFGQPVPVFDLILLGIGEDGHTVSLFPNTLALKEYARFFVANEVPAMQTSRITITFPLINCASNVLFLVSGSGKAEILSDVFDPNNATPYPVKFVFSKNVTWYMDQSAAGLLPESVLKE